MAPATARVTHEDLEDMPDEVRELIAPHIVNTPEALAAIGILLASKRDEAKMARSASGIEATWMECEEAYVGIDEANRSEYAGARWAKPMSMEGPLTSESSKSKEAKSTVFVRLTARYVDAGWAKLCEILLPPDDKAFKISEMPVPDLIEAKGDKSQVIHDGMGNVPLTRPALPGETQPPPATSPSTPASPTLMGKIGAFFTGGASQPAASVPTAGTAPATSSQPQPPARVPLTVADLAKEAIEFARKKAKAAEKRIETWLNWCRYRSELRKVIFDSSRCGVGVLKGPFPKSKRSIVVTKGEGDGELEMQIRDKIFPGCEWRDFWNIFPDPSCGEDIHDGEFLFERDYLSTRQLRGLKKLPGYLAKQIDKVLEEGPDKTYATTNGDTSQTRPGDEAKRKGRFEVWYYYGTLTREELSCIYEGAGTKLGEDEVAKEKKEVHAIVTLVNDTVVRATINPLDSGVFPYRCFPWQRRAGHWAGIGPAEQVSVPQRMLNASTRALLNNAGISAGGQIVLDQAAIKPANGQWTITPNKIWYKTGETPGQDVREAFAFFEVPNVTDQLMKIVNYAMQLAEESTSIPLVSQGREGPDSPETFGAAQLQDTNANQLLRSLGYAFDDFVTEPLINDYYEWLLLDPDVPDAEKGEFQIDAHGSVALVERAIQDQTIAQMGTLVLNPAYGKDPKKWMDVFLKSKRINPDDLSYTEEEQEKIDANPVKPVQVQVAEVNADTDLKLGTMKQGSDQQTQASEERIAEAANTLEGHKTATQATVDLHDIETRRQLAILEYANKHQITLSQAKVELAKTAMTLNTQERLNAQDNAVDLHKHHTPGAGASVREKMGQRPAGEKPLAQSPGRAGNGKSFEQAK